MKTLFEVYGFHGIIAMLALIGLLALFCAYKWAQFSARRKWHRNLLSPKRDAAVQQRMVDSYYDKKSGYLRG